MGLLTEVKVAGRYIIVTTVMIRMMMASLYDIYVKFKVASVACPWRCWRTCTRSVCFSYFGSGHSTYESFPIRRNLHEQLRSSNLHICIIYHIADLCDKLPDVLSALHFQHSVKGIVLQQIVVELAEGLHDVVIGFEDHDDFVDLVFIALDEL
jgi:hypothetical protein